MKMIKTKRKHGLTNEGRQWATAVDYRAKNKKWLDYSGKIALRVLSAIDSTEGMNQTKLAELMEVSPQQVSKIVSGNENLTLETIAKLSSALGVELIDFPKIK